MNYELLIINKPNYDNKTKGKDNTLNNMRQSLEEARGEKEEERSKGAIPGFLRVNTTRELGRL